MAFSAANIDPGTTPSLPVAVETINSKDYQAVKLVDGTVGSETPVGTSGNPLNTLDSQVLAELVLVLAKLNASIAVTGTFWQATQPVSGTVTTTPPSNASSNTAQIAGTTTSVNSGTVDAGTQRVADAGANTGTLSNVASSASSVTVLVSNTARRGATITNESTAILYLKFGATASLTSYTVQLAGSTASGVAYYEVPFGYNGKIDGIWASANGNARVTEITA